MAKRLTILAIALGLVLFMIPLLLPGERQIVVTKTIEKSPEKMAVKVLQMISWSEWWKDPNGIEVTRKITGTGNMPGDKIIWIKGEYPIRELTITRYSPGEELAYQVDTYSWLKVDGSFRLEGISENATKVFWKMSYKTGLNPLRRLTGYFVKDQIESEALLALERLSQLPN